MKVSVIMSTYNEPLGFVSDAIGSILNQTHKDFEFFIAVDNPDRIELIELLEKFKEKDSRIYLHVNSKNIGIAESLNNLINMCSCEYIFRMDADDISIENRIELQLKFMKDNSLDMSATNINHIKEDNTIVELHNLMNKDLSGKELANIQRFANIMCHPTWCVKKNLYIELNGYRNLVPAEDYDFILRAIEKNKKIGLLNNKLLNYRLNSKGISRNNIVSQYIMAFVLKNNFPNLHTKNVNQIIKEKEKMEATYGDFIFDKKKKIFYMLKQNEIKKAIKILLNKYTIILKYIDIMYRFYFCYYSIKNSNNNIIIFKNNNKNL